MVATIWLTTSKSSGTSGTSVLTTDTLSSGEIGLDDSVVRLGVSSWWDILGLVVVVRIPERLFCMRVAVRSRRRAGIDRVLRIPRLTYLGLVSL